MFSWLLYNTLCALPLALVALAAGRWRRTPPALEHLLWLFVLVRLALPPLSRAEARLSTSAPAIVASGDPSWGNVLVARVTRAFGTNWSTWAERGLLVSFGAVLLWVLLRELRRARAVELCVRRANGARGALERHVHDVATRLGVGAPRVRISTEASG